MRVIGYELRKLLHWKKLLIVGAVWVIIYQLFMSFYFEYFPNGSEGYEFDAAVEMVSDYGPKLDDEELKQFVAAFEARQHVFAEQIKDDARFQEAGVATFEEYVHHDSQLHQPSELRSYAQDFGKGALRDLLGELYAKRYILEWMEYSADTERFSLFGTAQQQALQRIVEEQQYRTILPEQVMQYFKMTHKYTTAAILIGVVVLTLPIHIGDRRRGMLQVQYTSRLGRRLYWRKLAAAMIGTAAWTTVALGVLFALLAQHDISMFMQGTLNSALMAGNYWLNLTLAQYMFLAVGCTYALAFGVCLLTVWLSRMIESYPVLIGMLVPLLFIVLTVGFNALLDRLLSLYDPWWRSAAGYALLSLSALALALWRGRREQRLDIRG
ncbi:putative ABC transporter permease [Paenibacillus sp. 598K]|uniref:hypothetical protein n=1 Tax=Paenibacillus sp. 598K TaxID=1117987 RepID=UPI000FF9DF6D|nr:hypothetical protein [Paenibacillus sp. 598K]GBF72133.1 putative ABC transporter permease [Paenibacillus sp. 598K]